MDYTDLTRVKAAMDSIETTADSVLSEYITRASRLIDRLCTSQQSAVDYFKAESVVSEVLTNGAVDYAGRLTIWPHKSYISAVSALSYRYTLRDAWTIETDLTLINIEQEAVVYEGGLPYAERIYAKVSYTGGLGASVSALPLDLIDAATVLAVRLYKEARSGLGDSIGVAELGQLVYTKAFPIRVVETLTVGGYMRTARWT